MEPADRESVFWIPSLQPEAVLLSAASSARASAAAPVDLTHLPGLDLRRADDGWHGVWRAGGTVHQFWLVPEAAGRRRGLYPDFAARRLVRVARACGEAIVARSSRPVSGPPLSGDARSTQGIAYSDIACPRRAPARRELPDHRRGSAWLSGTKTDWEGDPRKNKARRLVASGQRMMRGGYRTLLHYPITLPRRQHPRYSVRTGLAQLHPSI